MSVHRILLCCFLLVATTTYSQKLMQLPDSVKPNLEHFDIKLKSGVGYMRYQIGPYRLENTRRSWKSSSSSRGVDNTFISSLFSRNEETEIKQQSAFAFISEAADSAHVHITNTSTLRYTDYSRRLFGDRERPKDLESGIANFLAIIQYNKDSSEWSLATFNVLGESITKAASEVDSRSWLTNGVRHISLRFVYKFEDGKGHLTGLSLGCVFEEAGAVLGAIQFLGQPLTSLQKQNHLWLRRDLDASTKFIVATAATALMAHLHHSR